MTNLVKTLQHKASRSRMRRGSHGSFGDQESDAPDVPSPASSSNSLRFWRRGRASDPTPTSSEPPKPILRREPSPTKNGNVSFPKGHHPHRVSTASSASGSRYKPGYGGYPPPTAYRQNHLSPSRQSPNRAPSPAGSVRSLGAAPSRPPAQRYPTAPADLNSRGPATRTRVAPDGSFYNSRQGSQSNPVLSMPVQTPSPSRKSMYRYSPPSSPPKNGRHSVADTRSVRPQSSLSTSTQTTPPAAGLAQRSPPVAAPQARRPMSLMSSGGRRRSSRPSQPTGRSTRDSITSISSLHSTATRSQSPALAPESTNVISLSPSPTVQRLAMMSTSTLAPVPQSPDPEFQDPVTPNMANVTPPTGYSPFPSPSLASTPGGACPVWSPNPMVATPSVNRSGSLLRTASMRRAMNAQPGDGSPLPMFKVIPATPGDGRARLLAESESDETADKPEPSPARVLDFGDNTWIKREPSPRLDEAVPLNHGSPIELALARFGREEIIEEVEEESRTATPTPTSLAESANISEPAEQSTARLPNVRSLSGGPPPPKPAKNPARSKTLYTKPHDDGRSVSRSLAELAVIACDLPPFGAEMTAAAAAAAARLQAARAAVDASGSPRTRRAQPPRAPPAMPPPPIPNTAPFKSKGACRSAPSTPPRTVPRQLPACSPPCGDTCDPPSPSYTSFASLPSLVSTDSVPSNYASSNALRYESSVSLAANDVEEAMAEMMRSLGTRQDSLTPSVDDLVYPTTPKANAAEMANVGLGLNFDFTLTREVSPNASKMVSSPLGSPCTPTFAGLGLGTPPSPKYIHRMSAAGANPNRAAFYGAGNFIARAMESTSSLNFSDRESLSNSHHSHGHNSQGSISSLASDIASDISEDEVLTASIIALQPYTTATYIVRESPPAHEVGVAF